MKREMQPSRTWPASSIAFLGFMAFLVGCRHASVAGAVLRLNPVLGYPYRYTVDLRSRGISGPNYNANQTITFYAKDSKGFHANVLSPLSDFPFSVIADNLGHFIDRNGLIGQGSVRPVSSPGNALDGISFPPDTIRVGYTWWTNVPLSDVSPALAKTPEVFRSMPLPLKNRVTRINLKTVRIDSVASKRFFAPPPSKEILDLNLDAKAYINEEDGMLLMSVTQIGIQIYGKKTVDGHVEAIITQLSAEDRS